MPQRVVKRLKAQDDLREHFVYLGRQSLDTAERFLAMAEQAFELLAQMPELGSPCTFRKPGLAGLRTWRLRKFKRHVIYYRPLPDGIEVVRVLHGFQDAQRLLEQ